MESQKVGILTFWDSLENYGQILQAYALMTVLRKMGLEPFIVRYTREEETWNRSLFLRIREFIKYGMNFRKVLKRFLFETEKNPDRKFDDFRSRHMTFSDKTFPSFESLVSGYPKAEIYITGSDQVWGLWGSENKKKIYLLEFLPSDIRRIAYAASFGRNFIEKEEKAIFRTALEKFQSISVREKTGIEICKELESNSDIKWVVDPTLLLTKESWIKILDLKPVHDDKRKTAFVYLMNNEYTISIGRRIIKYLESENYRISYVATDYKDRNSNCNPTIEQWLSGIMSSDIVVTSSFHGLVFAMNFNVPFISIAGRNHTEGQNSRLWSLAEETGTQERVINNFNENEISKLLKSTIDWDYVNCTIANKRKASMDFLSAAIS